MARMQKLSISLPPALAEQVRDAAREDGVSLSAFMAESAEHGLRLRGMRIAVEEYQREHGWFTPEELAAAAAERPVIVGPGEWEAT
jgi:pyruvate/2-oxoglutarate dehydrogenase complex dihydrolipoamide acyltransferase (E2) component